MPIVAIRMLRLSLVWLLFAFASGSVLLLNKAFGFHPALWSLLPVHIDTAIFGWILQFVMATAYWMFPRLPERPVRGGAGRAHAMLVLLNTGILLSAFSFQQSWALFSGRLCLLLSVLLFARLMWGRVMSFRDP